MFDALGAVPLVGRFRSGDLIVPRFEGVTAGTMGGCAFAPLDVPEWQARTVIAVAGDGPVFVVTRDERGSAVFVFDDAMSAPRIERFDDVKLDDVMVLDDGRVAFSSARPEPAIFIRDNPGRQPPGDSDNPGRQPLALEEPPQFLSLRATRGPRLVFASSVTGGARPYEINLETFALTALSPGFTKLHGPGFIGDGLVMLGDGHLLTINVVNQLDELSVVDEGEKPYTCLTNDQSHRLIVCQDREMFALDAVDAEPIPYFRMTDLHGVDPTCPTSTEPNLQCVGEWSHKGRESGLFRFDGGLAEVDAGTADAEPVVPVLQSASPGGCALGMKPARQPGTALGGLALAGLLVCGRRRRAASPPDRRTDRRRAP